MQSVNMNSNPWQHHATEVLPIDAPRDQWLTARRAGIGASESAAVAGLSSYTTPYMVYLDKLGQLDPLEDTEQMAEGRHMESFIADRFSILTGFPLEQVGLLQSKQWPWMLASLDYRITGQPVGVECKKTSWRNADKWADDEIPSEYVIQALHQMAVTGDTHTYVAVKIGDDPVTHRLIERDSLAISRLVEKCEAFWKLVQDRNPPAAEPLDIPVLDKQTATPTQQVILTSDHIELMREKSRIIAEISRLEHDRDMINATIKQHLGAAEEAVSPSGETLLTYKTTHRASYTTKPTTMRQLRTTRAGKEFFDG